MYSMVQRREKEKDSRYLQEASAPAAVTVYQTCNIMYICNNRRMEIKLDGSSPGMSFAFAGQRGSITRVSCKCIL